MNTDLLDTTKKAIGKCKRISRTRPEIARKVIAFQELTSPKAISMSEREAAQLLEISRSTMRSWMESQVAKSSMDSVAMEFFKKPEGEECLQRIVMAAYCVIHFGCGGIRGLQEFLELSLLNKLVATSEGALQAFSVRCEEYIVSFGKNEERKLALKIKAKHITAGLDEMYRGKHPCLVAIDVISGYILVEKFTEDRTAETWTKELKPRLEELNVELNQVVSDLCGGIRSCAKEMGAIHIPELFHAQHEITKATSAPLAAQEKEFERALNESEEKLKKMVKKHGEDSNEAVEAGRWRILRRLGLQERRERRKKVQEAKKQLGKIHHPIDLATGKLQTPERIVRGFDKQLQTIETCAQKAYLSQSCLKRLTKARNAFDAISAYIQYFFVWYTAFVYTLNLSDELTRFFNEVVFPYCYFKAVWKRLSTEQRKILSPIRASLEAQLQTSAYPEKTELIAKGRECAEKFQRSSSCVEGRNGMLSLYHHRFHRLNRRSTTALTTVHNFHTKQQDGSTAAQRFFGCAHSNLFESMIKNVRIPGKPRTQYHDVNKRLLGRAKRRVA